MLRLTLLSLFITFLALYAWKDWYKSLCGLIVLMAVIEHPDMPKSLMGIQGLNPWNVLFLFVFMAWAFNRRREGLVWDLPRHITILLVMYFSFVFISYFRMISDISGLVDWATVLNADLPTSKGLFSEHIINSIKWVVPALLLYDGCRTQSRFEWGMLSLLAVYFLIGIQVIRWMPISTLTSGDELSTRALKILSNEVGYHRVNLSMMLAGSVWALYCAREMYTSGSKKTLLLIASALMFFAQALTGGRTGYVTWAAIGFVLGAFKWRKLLIFSPVALLLVALLVPAVQERMSLGFSKEGRDTNSRIEETMDTDDENIQWYSVTSGRSFAWPFVLKKIGEAPIFGHGREAMQATGISANLYFLFGELFPHPHNAYLQWLLDNGIVGFIPVILFFWLTLKYSMSLFLDKRHPAFMASGGVALSLVLALFFASFGSQSFYPREGSVPMWCAIALMFRVYVQRRSMLSDAPPLRALVPADKNIVFDDIWGSNRSSR